MGHNDKALADIERQAKEGGTTGVLNAAKKLAAEKGRAHDAPTVIGYRNAIGAMRAGAPGIWKPELRKYVPFPPEVEALRRR